MPRPFPLDLKPSRSAYSMWLRRKFRATRAVQGKAYYDIVTSSLQRQFEQSEFWREALANVDDYENAYRISHKDYGLLASSVAPIQAKDWDGFLDKTWRRNVVQNTNWPDAPTDGWLTPPDWFCSIKDVVRTLFVVKYMDGVLFLGDQLEQLARRHGLETETSLEGTSAGYYAGHLVVRHLADLPLENWRTEQRSVAVEIQITTQLHEVIRRLLHQHYERRRAEESDDDSWKWDHLSGEFQANYLGHILHYLDGQILRTRNEYG